MASFVLFAGLGLTPAYTPVAHAADSCSSGTIFGNGSSGSLTVTGSSNIGSGQYVDLTVDSGATLTISSGSTVQVCGTLTVQSTGVIQASYVGTGGAGGGTTSGPSCSENGGASHPGNNGAGGAAGSGGGGTGVDAGGTGACTAQNTGLSHSHIGGSGGHGGAGGLAGGSYTLEAWIVDNAGTVDADGQAGGAGSAGGNAGGTSSIYGAAGGGAGGYGGAGGNGGDLTFKYSGTTGSGLGTMTVTGGAGGPGGGAGSGSGTQDASGCTVESGGTFGGGSTTVSCSGLDGGSGPSGGAGTAGTLSQTQVQIVQPVQYTLSASGDGSAQTVTVGAGCNSNMSSFAGDGKTHFLLMDLACSVLATAPSTSTDEYNLGSGSTITSCASGTCTTDSVTYYHDYLLTNSGPTVGYYSAGAKSSGTGNAWVDSKTKFNVTGTQTWAFVTPMKYPYYVYQESSQGFLILGNTTIGGIAYVAGTPDTLSMTATKANVTMYEGSTLQTSVGIPKDVQVSGANITSSWVSPLLKFSGTGSPFVVQFGSGGGGGAPPSGGGAGGAGSPTCPYPQTYNATSRLCVTPPVQQVVAPIAGIGVAVLVLVIAGGYVSDYLGGRKGAWKI